MWSVIFGQLEISLWRRLDIVGVLVIMATCLHSSTQNTPKQHCGLSFLKRVCHSLCNTNRQTDAVDDTNWLFIKSSFSKSVLLLQSSLIIIFVVISLTKNGSTCWTEHRTGPLCYLLCFAWSQQGRFIMVCQLALNQLVSFKPTNFERWQKLKPRFHKHFLQDPVGTYY